MSDTTWIPEKAYSRAAKISDLDYFSCEEMKDLAKKEAKILRAFVAEAERREVTILNKSPHNGHAFCEAVDSIINEYPEP